MAFFKKYTLSSAIFLLNIANCNGMQISPNNRIKLTGKILLQHFSDKNQIGYLSEQSRNTNNITLGSFIIQENDLCVPVELLIHNDANPETFFNWTQTEMPLEMSRIIYDTACKLFTSQSEIVIKLLPHITTCTLPTLFLPVHILLTGVCKLELNNFIQGMFDIHLTFDQHTLLYYQTDKINASKPLMFMQINETMSEEEPLDFNDRLAALAEQADNFFETMFQQTDNALLSLNHSHQEIEVSSKRVLILSDSEAAFESNKYVHHKKNGGTNFMRSRILKNIADSQKTNISALLHQRATGSKRLDQRLTDWKNNKFLIDQKNSQEK